MIEQHSGSGRRRKKNLEEHRRIEAEEETRKAEKEAAEAEEAARAAEAEAAEAATEDAEEPENMTPQEFEEYYYGHGR